MNLRRAVLRMVGVARDETKRNDAVTAAVKRSDEVHSRIERLAAEAREEEKAIWESK